MKFWSPNQLLLIVISIILLHTHSSFALNLHLGEGDFSVREGSGKLRAIVVAEGDFGTSESVTVQVIPMTVSQFLNEKLTPIPEALNDADLDPAEAGDDFNDEVLTCTLQGGTSPVEKTVEVDIVDDDISEHPEVFLLVLKVVNATEGLEIEMERNVSVARIRQDSDSSKTKIGFNISDLDVDEGVGFLNNSLFIEIEGVAEPTLYVHLSVQGGSGDEDILLLESVISIPSGETRVPVLLKIIDDDIVEQLYEMIRISIASTTGQQGLFTTGKFETVTITIKDNDRQHFGFEVTSARTGNSTLQLLEGESAKVCALLLLEPEEFETDVEMRVQQSSGPTSLLSVSGLEGPYFFFRDNLKFCFNVTANENKDINEPNTATFNMTPNTDLFYWPEDINRIDIDDLHIVILDNDGIPKPPGNIELSLTNKEQDLLVTWTSESSKLQPISHFRVIVSSADINGTKSNIRSRRQSDVEQKEHITTEERLLLENIKSRKMYTIEVCAENDFGQTCATPKHFAINGKDGEPRKLVLISNGLQPSDESESATVVAPLSQGYIIAIVLLPLILVLAVCILIISVIICSCCRYNSKHYYPSQQEKKMEKQIEAMEARYHTRTTSTGSLNSTTSSASDFTRV